VQEDGVFSRDRYEMLLRQQGMSPVGFEMDLRTDLLVNQITSGIQCHARDQRSGTGAYLCPASAATGSGIPAGFRGPDRRALRAG
jgi:hypothetical protein